MSQSSQSQPSQITDVTLHMIGNAHLDPVWLWQWPEGLQEAKATFRSALDRMTETPEFVFTSSSAAIYEWVEENDPANAWPRTIVYRNLRHHAATKWFHEELGEPWEVVAQYLGDKLTTVLNHYVRAGEDALRDSVGKLANL